MALFAKVGQTEFGVGDTIRLHQQITEEGKKRTHVFEGIVIGIKGVGVARSFTVRKVLAGGYGVERIFPLSSPTLLKLDVVRKGTQGVHQAKLYYLRKKPKKAYEDIIARAARKGKVTKRVKGVKDKRLKKESVAEEK